MIPPDFLIEGIKDAESSSNKRKSSEHLDKNLKKK